MTHKQKGFTLTEVIAALAIVGVALLYFSHISLENNEKALTAYRMRELKSVVREKIEEFLIARTSEEQHNIKYSGEFETAPGLFWSISDHERFEIPFDETEEDRQEKGYTRYLVRVQMRVFYKTMAGEKDAYNFSTMIQEVIEHE